MKTIWNTPSIRSGLFIWLIFAILLSACATAPAPVDNDVVNLLSGTTNWIINQLSKNPVPAGVEVLYHTSKELLVVGTPFQEGYGFTILDRKTFTALEDANIAKSLCGNYVNCVTWEAFRSFLQQNGWVTQIVMFTASITRTWFTFVVGAPLMPLEIKVDGKEIPDALVAPGFGDFYLDDFIGNDQ